MWKAISVFTVLVAFASPAFGTTVYKWVDREGVVNFTDDQKKIPPLYRDQVVTEIIEESTIRGLSAPPPSRAIKTDIYGRDKTWWKQNVQLREEELKEATGNYERVNQQFIKEAEALSQVRFGSRTQVKMRIFQLDRINNERAKYEEQMVEAKQALQKLLSEAEESKADPAWLN